jgi:hypothetical protein
MLSNAESVQGSALSVSDKDGRGSSTAPNSALSVTDDEGRWSFDGIPDGVYTIMVNPGYEVIELEEKTRHPDSLKTYEAISRDITVQGKDMEGIKLEVKESEKKKSKSDSSDEDDTSTSDNSH